MGKTILYLIGVLALHYTDFSHASAFNRLFLPCVSVVFLCFLLSELLLFFSSISTRPDSYNIYDLIRDLCSVRYDIQQSGFISTVLTLGLSLIDCLLLFVALWYAFELLWNAALA